MVLAVAIAAIQTRSAELPRYSAKIRWTAFGIPHVKAADFDGLGFGAGYAAARANPCLLLDMAVTVRGERARLFGAQGTALAGFAPVWNVDSDVFFKSYLDADRLEQGLADGPREVAALVAGYAAGASRYLADVTPQGLPAACRNAGWVRPITTRDVALMVAQKAVEGSGAFFLAGIVNSGPPGTGQAPPPPPVEGAVDGGSNGYALGRDLVAGSTGILAANPHLPWQGPNRLFEIHLTIPGKLDVMGASFLPFPVVVIGFNKDVAWTHTVTTSRRLTLQKLRLSPGDPTSYEIDGRAEKMVARTVDVDVKQPDGSVTTVRRVLYRTRFGPVVKLPELGFDWTEQTAFALADADVADQRVIKQWLRLDQARDVGELTAALRDIRGTPWVNTLAADRSGRVVFADMSPVPRLPDERLADCMAAEAATGRMAQVIVLDGSRSACDWQRGEYAQSLLPAEAMPVAFGTDYVLNSNDSAWLVNRERPMTDLPRIVGLSGVRQRWRTRMGYKMLGELMAAKPGAIGQQDVEAMLLSDRNYAGELVGDDVAAFCRRDGAAIDVACRTLAAWDRRDTVASRGAAFFREFWRRALTIPRLWARPFDPRAPLETPSVLNLDDAAVRLRLHQALADTTREFQDLGLPPDVALADLQHRDIGMSVPGGGEAEGVLNELTTGRLGRDGYPRQGLSGSSYIAVVTWNAAGPVADALLTYSQSADPDSSHAADQTRRYVDGAWIRLPFTDAEIASDPALETLALQQ